MGSGDGCWLCELSVESRVVATGNWWTERYVSAKPCWERIPHRCIACTSFRSRCDTPAFWRDASGRRDGRIG